VHYSIDSTDGGGHFGSVILQDGSLFATVTEKFSRAKFSFRVDVHADGVVRLRIDEAAPLNGKQRYVMEGMGWTFAFLFVFVLFTFVFAFVCGDGDVISFFFFFLLFLCDPSHASPSRYSPRDILLDSLKRIPIENVRIGTKTFIIRSIFILFVVLLSFVYFILIILFLIGSEHDHVIIDLGDSKQFRFSPRLQCDLLVAGAVVASANARGLFHMEHFRLQQQQQEPNSGKDGSSAENSQNHEVPASFSGGDASSEFLANNQQQQTSESVVAENVGADPIDMTNAWSESFSGETDTPKHGMDCGKELDCTVFVIGYFFACLI
jgi:hypothetical protein